MHDGMGFLTQHIALTADYEVALRAVDAAVTVPYWDFTYRRPSGKFLSKRRGAAAAGDAHRPRTHRDAAAAAARIVRGRVAAPPRPGTKIVL